MIDLETLRNHPETVTSSIKKRGGAAQLVDSFLEFDKKWRLLIQKAEELRGERNKLTVSKESAQHNRERLGEIKEELQALDAQEKTLAIERQNIYLRIPQIIDEDVPVGPGESANKVIKTVGEITHKNGKPHEQLMSELGWLDMEQAAQVSGARFRYLEGQAALAHLTMVNKAVQWATSKGFTPIIPPVLLKEETLIKGGFFPTGKEDTFKVEESYLAGTSEPMLVALGANMTFNESELPRRFVGFSTCFRREAGSYGKDTQGMIRQHQFDKVEMVSITTPEQSKEEHEFLRQMQEEFVSQFGLPYQVVLIGSGDLEIKATRRYDIETYFPGQQRYRETHSVSNCGDYQARRFNIKVKDQHGERLAHTLNGTLYTERLLLALIENNQQPDGSVDLLSKIG